MALPAHQAALDTLTVVDDLAAALADTTGGGCTDKVSAACIALLSGRHPKWHTLTLRCTWDAFQTGSVGFTRRAGATRTVFASISHLLAKFPGAIQSCSASTCPAKTSANNSTTALVFGREEAGGVGLCASHHAAAPDSTHAQSFHRQHSK